MSIACPVRTDARGYVTAIARVNTNAPIDRARDEPFRFDMRLCVVRRAKRLPARKIDTPIAIRALKRFVDDLTGLFRRDGRSAEAARVATYVGTTRLRSGQLDHA